MTTACTNIDAIDNSGLHQNFEPYHEKICFYHVRTTKAQISLRIHTVWSAALLFAS